MLKYNLDINVKETCESAISGQQAIDIIKKNVLKNHSCCFKLILIDYEMPGLNGPETTNLIREFLYSREIDQPIIAAVTAHSD